VLPIFGRDWSQDGVADLFTAIERNQYKFMYLSARAIGQSRITRDLLKNINQNGYTLPEGIFLNKLSLVLFKASLIFKIYSTRSASSNTNFSVCCISKRSNRTQARRIQNQLSEWHQGPVSAYKRGLLCWLWKQAHWRDRLQDSWHADFKNFHN